MAADRINDPFAFRDFLNAKLAADAPPFTLDDVLIQWEAENQADEERRESLQAIREGLDDVAAGRTRPFEEFDREFRGRHGLPQRR